jgi:hypothetical protein
MRTELGHDGETHHHHRNRHFLQRFEGYADLIMVGALVILALAMVIGLLTADGRVGQPW